MMDTIRAEIDSSHISFEQAAQLVSSDKSTRNSGGLMTSQMTGTARMSMEELPPEVARQVATMRVGEVSQPFTMKDPKTGRDQVAIVRLKNRIEGHKANYQEDYQVIKELYEDYLTEQILDDFIRQKQRETYVRIKPGWDKGDFHYPGWVK